MKVAKGEENSKNKTISEIQQLIKKHREDEDSD